MKPKEFYQSREWKDFNPFNRALILLVNEGVKPGISVGFTQGIDDILDRLKLDYVVRVHRDLWLYYISKDRKVLSDFSSFKIKKNEISDIDVIQGRFYGYPGCCIEEFAKTSLSQRKTRPRVDLREEYRIRNLEYPPELDYKMWVPCKFDCQETIILSGKYRDVLCEYDKEAADMLRLVINQKILKPKFFIPKNPPNGHAQR